MCIGLCECRGPRSQREKLWIVAQAVSEVPPDGNKDKELLQGLLEVRDKVEEVLAE